MKLPTIGSFEVGGSGDTPRDEPPSRLHRCCARIEVSPGDVNGSKRVECLDVGKRSYIVGLCLKRNQNMVDVTRYPVSKCLKPGFG